jgi:hypothetical protein
MAADADGGGGATSNPDTCRRGRSLASRFSLLASRFWPCRRSALDPRRRNRPPITQKGLGPGPGPATRAPELLHSPAPSSPQFQSPERPTLHCWLLLIIWYWLHDPNWLLASCQLGSAVSWPALLLYCHCPCLLPIAYCLLPSPA